MGSFRTRRGRCVIAHGDVRLESLGLRGRLKRGVKNTKLAHEQRYRRGLVRFVAVLLFGLWGVGGFVYRLLFGGARTMLLGVAVVAAVFGLFYGYTLVRRFVRRWFRGFTGERTIPVRTIESVDPRPKRLLRRPHFVVHYDEYGTEKKRYVGVCGLTPLAADEFETAKAVLLDDHDLPVTPA